LDTQAVRAHPVKAITAAAVLAMAPLIPRAVAAAGKMPLDRQEIQAGMAAMADLDYQVQLLEHQSLMPVAVAVLAVCLEQKEMVDLVVAVMGPRVQLVLAVRPILVAAAVVRAQ